MKKCCASISMILVAALMMSCAKTRAQTFTKLDELPVSRVHFLFNSDEVMREDLALVQEVAGWLSRHKSAVVILEGHCDENGPTEYNVELGDRRARAVKAELIRQGVSYDRVIMVVSFGETRPLDPFHNNDAWRKNRRVEFMLR